MLKQFEDIDPLAPQKSGRVLATHPSDEDPTKKYHLIAVDGYIIIAVCEFTRVVEDAPKEWFVSQIVVPKRGIPWFVDTLENKFFKTPAEGGLTADEFKWTEEIDGERLEVRRSFGTVGYVLSTLSRRTERGFALGLTFTDEFLFEHAMYDVFKRVAARVRSGEV
jgi:hypothetical protein